MKVYISGVHSGPNPSPGIGLARSLRAAYPGVQLVAVDYSNRSSGLHSPEFDGVWIQRPWDELDLTLYSMQVRKILEGGALWLSGLDLEIAWLVRTFGEHPNLLIPSSGALAMVAKPEIPVHRALPMRVPPFIPASCLDWDLHAFCREHGWRVWCKGPYYEAHRVRSWAEFNIARSALSRMLSTQNLFIQVHIPGHEESIAFSAHKGMLLDCVYMSKRDVTAEGKTWAARVTEVQPGILESLRKVVEQLSWTGGAEIEFVRDCNNELWLIDWNPRFPAWIYGATIAGHNLPASLIQSATGVRPVETPIISQDFTRVVLEIPCRPDFPLSPLPEPPIEPDNVLSKHPSGMPKLAKRLRLSSQKCMEQGPEIPRQILDDIESLNISNLETPYRLQLHRTALARFERFANLASELSDSRIMVQFAYSIKTDPDDWLLKAAFDCGMLAEAISQLEVERALSNGFSLKQIVLNGPAKWWPSQSHTIKDFRIVFADSVEELDTYRDFLPGRIGFRLRLPSIDSRFGVPLDEYESFQRLVSVLKGFSSNCAIGLHFHLPSSTLGIHRWWQLCDSFLGWAKAVESTTGKLIYCLDVGGGWFPDDADRALQPNLKQAVPKAAKTLANLREFILEPGKALTQPAMALAVRVLEIRHLQANHRDVIVDGAISDLPMASFFPHRILARNGQGEWQSLGRGDDRILGRLCMEDDILAEMVRVPRSVRPGDILVICDAGAYNRSMSYAFGKG